MNRNSTKILSFLLFISLSFSSAKLFAQLKADFTFTSDSVCAAALDTLHNASSGGTEPYTYYWDYGNTQTSTGSLGTTNYYTSGTYYIKLRVTDANNNKDSITKKIIVLDIPKADYSAKRIGCGPVYFIADEDSTSQTTISNYLWVGQGAPGYGPLYLKGDSGAYQYTSGGTYHYELIVTATNGCTAMYNDSIKVASYPGISLPNDTSVCKNAVITITATPINGTPPYTIWWGSSAHISGATINPTILNDTAFAVHIIDAIGCANYDSIWVNVYPKANAHWNMTYTKDSIYLKAQDLSYNDTSYFWLFQTADFLRSTRGNGQSFRHSFSRDSDYNIALIIVDTNGCTSSYDSTIYGAQLGISSYQTLDLLANVYPNPFYSTTTLKYSLTHQTNVEIGIYDITGKKIADIANEIQQPGLKQIDFDTEKYRLNPGVYILKLTTDEGIISLHMVKL